jgi:hypothetical protein
MSFIDYIEEGNLDKAKEYLINNPNYDIHEDDEEAFSSCCARGHLDVTKWLWDISNHKINIHALNDYVFSVCCVNGHLDIAKWLWDISDQSIDIHTVDEFVFCWCLDYHLDIAKWLLNLDFDYFINYIKENKINDKIKLELQNIIDKKIIENMIQSRPQINKDTIVVI